MAMEPRQPEDKKLTRWKGGTRVALNTLVTFVAISALVGGYGLIAAPNGSLLGLPVEWLDNTIFNNYRVPGLILFSILGIWPALVCFGLFQDKRWAKRGSISVGVLLVLWIGIQIGMIGLVVWPPLQFFYGLIGAVITFLAWRSDHPSPRIDV